MPEVTRTIHGVVVRATVDDGLEPQANGFLELFEDLPSSALEDGRVIQVGWGALTPRVQADGSVTLTAPDHAGATPNWVSDLSMEARVLSMQVMAIRSLGVTPQECLARHEVLVEDAALTADDVYFHRRSTTRENDSGWFLGLTTPGDRGPMSRVPAYTLLRSHPALVAYLMLPDESLVLLRGGAVVGVRGPDASDLSPADGPTHG